MLAAGEGGQERGLIHHDDIRILVQHRNLAGDGAFRGGAPIKVDEAAGAQDVIRGERFTGIQTHFTCGEALQNGTKIIIFCAVALGGNKVPQKIFCHPRRVGSWGNKNPRRI